MNNEFEAGDLLTVKKVYWSPDQNFDSDYPDPELYLYIFLKEEDNNDGNDNTDEIILYSIQTGRFHRREPIKYYKKYGKYKKTK